jgi:hypothetical protein
VIIKSAYYGLTLTSKSPTVLNTLFINNYEGVRATGASNPTINNCDFINNSTYGINNVDKSFTINAQNCWWNDNSGPTHASNPSGTGDKITDAVLYNPFRTIDAQNPMMGDVSLNGRVQAYDAALVLQKSVNAISLNAIQTRVADVSGTSGITAFDGSLILQYVVNKIQGFPAEELFKKAKTITPAFARLQIENKEILVGDTFTIPIQISKADLAQSIDLQIKYEPSLLNLLDLTAGSYAQNLSFNQNIDSINGMIYLSLASVDNLKTDGDFVYLTFIAKNTHSKQTNASLTINKFLANETDMLSEIVGGSILINNKATGISQIKNVYLDAAYPNPFSDVVNIPIVLSKSSSNVTLEIYSMYGSQVYTKTMDYLKTGGNVITWDGKNTDGLTLGNGAYVIYIKTADEHVTQKLLLSK